MTKLKYSHKFMWDIQFKCCKSWQSKLEYFKKN